MIRQKLANLDEHLSEAGNRNNITKFNNQVKQLLNSPTARGETTQDLQTNLFKAYASCSDKVFVKYIFDLQTRYEDGENINAEMLMERLAQKYKNMSTRGIWEAPSPEDDKLLALTTTIRRIHRGRRRAGVSIKIRVKESLVISRKGPHGLGRSRVRKK